MTATESTRSTPIFVGIDVHKESISVAALRGWDPEFHDEARMPNDMVKVRRYFIRLRRGGPVRACYEAGGCGYVLERELAKLGVECEVIAPSLIPKPRGARVKTDRRDARMLARLFRSGDLTPIHVPSEAEESLRELVRLRDTVRREVHRSKQYVLKLLQRHDLRCSHRSWTVSFWKWLRGLELSGFTGEVLGHHLALLDAKLLQLAAVDARLEAVWQQDDRLRGPVSRLRCLRGIDTLSALVLATEVVDVRRFPTARHMMSWVGLGVSESSSGEEQRRGGITKAGNGQCRRILIEAAWHARHRPAVNKSLAQRQADQDPLVVAHARRAMHRLHKRSRSLGLRKDGKTTVVAVARELVGFVWALLHEDPALLIAPRRR